MKRYRVIKSALSLSALLMFSVNACTAPSDSDRAKKYRPAAVTVAVVEKENGELFLGHSSGVLLGSKNGIVLTSNISISNRENDYPIMCYVDDITDEVTNLNDKVMSEFIQIKENQCVFIDELRDYNIAVLQLVQNRERAERGADVAVDRLPETGENVYGLHSPRKLHGTFYKGRDVRVEEGQNINENAPEGFQLPYSMKFTAPTAPGSIGAMVMDKDDKLTGVTIIDSDQTQTVFAVPMKLIYPRIKKYLE